MSENTNYEKVNRFMKWVMGMGILAPVLGFVGGIIAILFNGPEAVVIITAVTTINVMIVYGAYKMKKELDQRMILG